jgi:hypothetical protein
MLKRNNIRTKLVILFHPPHVENKGMNSQSTPTYGGLKRGVYVRSLQGASMLLPDTLFKSFLGRFRRGHMWEGLRILRDYSHMWGYAR